MRITTGKYLSDPRKHRYELVMNQKQPNRIFIGKELAINVIIDYRTTASHKFKKRLGFKQHDVILTKEQSKLAKV